WYFPNDGLGHSYSGMPFYDASTTAAYLSAFGSALPAFTDNTADPTAYPDAVSFLSGLIGNFTDSIMSYVRGAHSNARFEVLYPTDVNQTAFNRAINYPSGSWTASVLDCLKTESFGFTFGRDLNKAEATMAFGSGFSASKRSHLV